MIVIIFQTLLMVIGMVTGEGTPEGEDGRCYQKTYLASSII